MKHPVDNHAAGVHMMMEANHRPGIVHTVGNHTVNVSHATYQHPHGMYGGDGDLRKMAMGRPQSYAVKHEAMSREMNSSEYHQRWRHGG